MAQSRASEAEAQTERVAAGGQTGRYVYCVARAGERVSLGPIGIDGRETYTVVCRGLAAVVHLCPAQPYQSDDGDIAAAWVLAHHRVVDAAWQRWGTALPLTFNTIIAAGTRSAEENVAAWLESEYESLKGRLDSLVGKAEYGVQVVWNPTAVARKIAETSPDMRALEQEIGGKPRGLAYMYRQKLEAMLKREMEARAEEESRALYRAIRRCVDNVHVEKVKKAEEGRQMLINLSCLVLVEKYRDLEAELDKIRRREDFSVRIAGPLPPYSFC